MKYAYFNPETGLVLSWLDTETNNYVLPDAAVLHECTDEEWQLERDSVWAIIDGSVVPYVEPEIIKIIIPDILGLVSAIKSEIGIVAAASIPGSALMLSALQLGEWADASALIDNALTLNHITIEQHSALKAAALTFHVPLTLS